MFDIFQIGSCGCFFTIRLYRDSGWGKRVLGAKRIAFDFGRISFLFEKYL